MECALCKNEIETKKEKYVHVEDYDKEEKIKEIWCHVVCFNKAMNRDLTQMEKQAQMLLSKANNIFESDMFKEMFPDQETYQIK